MKLSPLQKFILREVAASRSKNYSRSGIIKFYNGQAKHPKIDDIQNIITKSLERLIDKELLIGFGRRTSQKWFIGEVKLTPLGRRTARSLLGRQQALPLHLKKKK
ncbi:MAG: hypothetical protein PHH01_03125 [Patescibacteria group bacterium]|nr:hypothetical protein [Patescibacteria group bacterium]